MSEEDTFTDLDKWDDGLSSIDLESVDKQPEDPAPTLGFPGAKLPNKTSDSKDTPTDIGFAKPRNKKKKKQESRRKKQPPTMTQKICQLASPKYKQPSSSDSSSKSSSANSSLATKSDTSKKSANSYSALSEEQDFRHAESG